MSTNNPNIKSVVIPDDYPSVFLDSQALNRLRRVPNISVSIYNTRADNRIELKRRIDDAHTVIVTRTTTRLDEDIIVQDSKTLKHIAVWGTATDHIDLVKTKNLGILVTNTPDTHYDSVAEHALALMFALARRIPQLDQRVRDGEWPRGNVTLLNGKTLGIIGTGRVGERLGVMAAGIGMNVIFSSIQEIMGGKSSKGNQKQTNTKTIPEILKESDVVSLHARLTDKTKYLIGSKELSLMKPTVFLINTARGELVNEPDLITALINTTIAGAALDVFENEPLSNSTLKSLPNVILSPHIAGATDESISISLNQVIDAVIDNITDTG